MTGLCAKIGVTPEQLKWEVYGPQALQYMHAILYADGQITVAPAKPVAMQAQALCAAPAVDLLAL